MARSVNIWSKSLIAAADLSSSQYGAVVVDTNGKAALPGSAGVQCVGILQDKPKSGQVGTVMVLGESKAVAGTGGVTAGDALHAATDGSVVTATSGKFILGIALDTAAAGAYTTVVLVPGGKV